MKVKLLKKLRREARSRVTIYSVTTEESWRGRCVTGMSIGYSLPQYANIFSFGMTEEDVKKKAEKIFFETEMGWVRKKYKKYTRRYKHGTNLKFNSAICTSHSQSERLLSLGLKKETADMGWVLLNNGEYALGISKGAYSLDIPAWSLHRLWELLGKIKKYEGEDELLYPRISLVEDDVIFVSPKSLWSRRNFCSPKGVYENIINCLEELIKEGYFNKEYLEEKI